jgi:MFS family permease
MKCIAMGLPTWFVIGILATFSNEFGKALGIPETIRPGLSIMWCYVGLSVGDLTSGFLSHALHSRKKAVALMMLVALVGSVLYLFLGIKDPVVLYGLFLLMGIGVGYWAMFVTISAEQFGTNLRATAATTVPNMVRGTVVLMTSLYGFAKPGIGVIYAAAIVGVLSFVLGFYATLTIPETHGRDLDFLEE